MALARTQGPTLALLAACLFGTARYEAFLTTENLLNVLRQNSMLGLVSLGMTFVILSGGVDLSVGALLAVGGVAAARLSGHGSLVAIIAGVVASAALGFANGLTIAKGRMPPFVATLAMMIAARGALLGLSGDDSIPLASSASAMHWLGRGAVASIPAPIALLVLAYVLGWLALRYLRFGRQVYAVGDDAIAARLLGLHVDRVLVATYVLSGALAGLAGVVLAARLGAGQPVAGMGWELDAIAAVVVGGTLLSGGQGGAGLSLVGVLLFGVMLNLLNLEGTVSPWWQWVIRGAFLLAVAMVQNRLVRRAGAG